MVMGVKANKKKKCTPDDVHINKEGLKNGGGGEY